MGSKKRWSWGHKYRGPHALTTRGSVQGWGLLYFSQLPEQLREKLTGSKSFQQTQVLAG